MWDWLWNNKHWVFDGWGVAIIIGLVSSLSGLVALIYRRYFKPQEPQHKSVTGSAVISPPHLQQGLGHQAIVAPKEPEHLETQAYVYHKVLTIKVGQYIEISGCWSKIKVTLQRLVALQYYVPLEGNKNVVTAELFFEYPIPQITGSSHIISKEFRIYNVPVSGSVQPLSQGDHYKLFHTEINGTIFNCLTFYVKHINVHDKTIDLVLDGVLSHKLDN